MLKLEHIISVVSWSHWVFRTAPLPGNQAEVDQTSACVQVGAVAQWASALNLGSGEHKFNPHCSQHVVVSLGNTLHPKSLLWGLSTVWSVCKSLWIKASNRTQRACRLKKLVNSNFFCQISEICQYVVFTKHDMVLRRHVFSLGTVI